MEVDTRDVLPIGGEQTIALHIIANTRDSPLNLFKPI